MNQILREREKHVYVSGKPGYGKTTLLQAMIYQDIMNGEGVCVIDGKGDKKTGLVPQVLKWVPEFRKTDVIYLDLDMPVPIDFMHCNGYQERMRLVDDIVQIFERMESGIGTRMQGIIEHSVTALNLTGGTFFDLYRIITSPEKRQEIRQHNRIRSDPDLRIFWENEADRVMKGEAGLGVAISRMSRFILSPQFNVILDTPNPKLKIENAVRNNKIILVRLDPGSKQGMLFGSLVFSKVKEAVFKRGSGRPYYLYVDEFHKFASRDFADVLEQGRGLGLHCILSNQYLNQLDTSTQQSIINAISTFFLFHMLPSNAAALKELLSVHAPKPDLQFHRNNLKRLLKDQRDIYHNLEERQAWRDKAIREDGDDYSPDNYGGKAPYQEMIDAQLRNLKENERKVAEAEKNLQFAEHLAKGNSLGIDNAEVISELNDAIRDAQQLLKNAEHHLYHDEFSLDAFTEEQQKAPIRKNIEKATSDIARWRDQIRALKRPPANYLDMLPRLQPGEAIYKPASDDARKIKTPPPPPSLESVGKTDHSEWIKGHTLAKYGISAQKSQKRQKLSPSSNSTLSSHNEGDGKPDPDNTPEDQAAI